MSSLWFLNQTNSNTHTRSGFNQSNPYGFKTESYSNTQTRSGFNQSNPYGFKTESNSNRTQNSSNSFNYNNLKSDPYGFNIKNEKTNDNSGSTTFNHWDMSSHSRGSLGETLPLNNETNDSNNDTQRSFDPNPYGFKNGPNTLGYKKDSFGRTNDGSWYGWNMYSNRHREALEVSTNESISGPRSYLENNSTTTQEKFNKALWSYDTSTQIKQEKTKFKFWQKFRK